MNSRQPMPGRDFMKPGRSLVRSPRAMVATSSGLATQVALDILRQGGNAVDAAIGGCAMLTLTEPHQTGPGGDCFALIAFGGSDRIVAYNGSGRAPAHIDRADVARRMPLGIEPTMPESVTVPGAVDAWCQLSADHGRLPLADVLAPAIDYAENGVVVQDRVAFDWRLEHHKFDASPELAKQFAPGGEALKPGSRLTYPALSRTLRSIAFEGRTGFYDGPVARSIVNTLKTAGGVHTLDDFKDHKGTYVTTISTDYRDYTVHQCPPNGQGVVALALLKLLEWLPLDPEGPMGPWRLHSLAEAARMAFKVRDSQLADPDFSSFNWSQLFNPEFTETAASRIRPDSRLPDPDPPLVREHCDTVYICVVDEERTAVSFINSLFESFGSAIYDPETGIVLHNRGLSFSVAAGHPNSIASRKRPMHTIMPGLITQAGRAVMPFGVMGGHFQPVGHALLLSHMFDYGLDLQTAIDLPRLFPSGGKLWVESGIDEASRVHLAALGHSLADRLEPAGGAQAIWIDHETGLLVGGSDPRKDGAAAGF